MKLKHHVFYQLAFLCSILVGSGPAFCEEWTDIYYHQVENNAKNTRVWNFYYFNESTGEKKLFSTFDLGIGTNVDENHLEFGRQHWDKNTGRFRVVRVDGTVFEFNRDTGAWSQVGKDAKTMLQTGDGDEGNGRFVQMPGVIANDDGTVSIGLGSKIITIDGNGVSVDGKSLVKREVNASGEEELHIGENSLITVENNGVQKLYAKDANGKAIPINISEGSDLLVKGVSVMGSIEENAENIEINQKNISTNASNIEANRENISTNASNIEANRENINDLGYGVAGATALTAALSSLPIAVDDAPFSCGVGTGGYSSRFAMGLGCAARVNERLSLNVGGSHVFGGSSDYGGGSLGTIAARGGFVFKLGTIHKTSNLEGEELQSQLDEVRQENKELLARLERLEAIALGQDSSVTKVSLK